MFYYDAQLGINIMILEPLFARRGFQMVVTVSFGRDSVWLI